MDTQSIITRAGRRWRRWIVAGLVVGVVVAVAVIRRNRGVVATTVQVVALRGVVSVDGRRLVRAVSTTWPSGGRLAVEEDGAADLHLDSAGRLQVGSGTHLAVDRIPDMTVLLDHGPLDVQWSAAQSLAVLTPQALVRIGAGTVRIDVRPHQTVVTVDTGTAEIAARSVDGARSVSAGGEAVLGNQGWDFQSNIPPRILPWAEARILASMPMRPQPVPGVRIHGHEVQRLAWPAPTPTERGREPTWNGVVWPLQATGREQRCSIWLRALRVVPAVPDAKPGMAVDLLIDQGNARFRLATTRIAATSTDWQLLGGDIGKAVPVDGGGLHQPPRVEVVQAVALSLPRGAVVLEVGPLLVQTPLP